LKDIRAPSRICFQGATRNLLLFVHDGQILKFNWEKNSLQDIHSFADRTWDWDVSADGRFLVATVGHKYPSTHLVDLSTMTTVYTVRTSDTIGHAVVAISSDGLKFAVGTSAGALTLYDTSAGNVVAELKQKRSGRKTAAVTDLEFSPDGDTLVALETNVAGVSWWDLARNSQQITALEKQFTHLTLAYAPNGRELAVGLTNGLISIRDARTRQETVRVDAHESAASCLRYSPDSCLLGSISQGSKVIFYDRT
jgi:WD40 repeat protein